MSPATTGVKSGHMVAIGVSIKTKLRFFDFWRALEPRRLWFMGNKLGVCKGVGGEAGENEIGDGEGFKGACEKKWGMGRFRNEGNCALEAGEIFGGKLNGRDLFFLPILVVSFIFVSSFVIVFFFFWIRRGERGAESSGLSTMSILTTIFSLLTNKPPSLESPRKLVFELGRAWQACRGVVWIDL